MIKLILFALFSIAFSFLCSILEAVLLSITPRYIKQEVEKGSSTGRHLEAFKKDIDRPLSAILTLNTIAHTVGAIMVGATAGDLFGTRAMDIFGFEVTYETLIAALMTLAILYASEIIPKTIGANNWRSLTPFTVRVLRMLMTLLAPLIWVSEFITKRFKKEKEKSILSRSDILSMAVEGETSGVLAESESTMIKNILQFEQKTVRDIMTPRSVAFMLQKDLTIKEYMAEPEMQVYSRIPVFGKDKDDVLGIILKDDLLVASAAGRVDASISEFVRDVTRFRETTTLPDLVRSLSEKRQHLFLVNDEFGHVIGLVTMEDLFEELLGHEIMDESDEVADLQDLARERAKE